MTQNTDGTVTGHRTVLTITNAFLSGTDTDTIGNILAYGEEFARTDAIEEARHVLKIKAPGSFPSNQYDGSWVGWGPNWD